LSSLEITFLGQGAVGLVVGLLDPSDLYHHGGRDRIGLVEEDWSCRLHRSHDGLEQLSSASSFPRIGQQVVLGGVGLVVVRFERLRQSQ